MPSPRLWLLLLATVTTAFTAANDASATDASWDEDRPDTVFNGQTVPPMMELGETNMDTEIRKGNWFVEFFSPYCIHCTRFKPTYQTAYEFYYTSKPIQTQEDSSPHSLNSFTRYYDFKFARVDCVAFADVCKKNKVNSYPAIIYFKDGKETQRKESAQTMKNLSQWIEELLEAVRPGSRKEGGPRLPKPGAKSVEMDANTEKASKEEEEEEEEEEEGYGDGEKEKGGQKHTSPTSTPAKSPPAKPKAASNANPSGVVEVLTADNFQHRVADTLEPWFIKFYAPWCHHCLALAPTWANVARHMKGKLNMGEVNCEVERKLCKDARIQGYPTIMLVRGSERIEYNGLRGLGDFLDYAGKITDVAAGVVETDGEGLKKMEETEEVIFVYFYDHATTSEDFHALDRLTLTLVGRGKLVKTKDKTLFDRFKLSTWPRLMVLRDGQSAFYPPTTPRDMRDSKKVVAWMKTVWHPMVPELSAANAREIMDGKLVVLAVLSRERANDFELAKQELKNTAREWIEQQEAAFRAERQRLRDAKQLRIDEAEKKDDQKALREAKLIRVKADQAGGVQVAFAWVDGVFWERWIKSTYGVDVKDGERVIINDEENHRYWDTTGSGEAIRLSRASILATLATVTSHPSRIRSKSTTNWFMRVFMSVYHVYAHHPVLLMGVVVGLVIGLVMHGRSRGRRGGYGGTVPCFKMGEKDGLLGGGSGGGGGAKHD